jgi:hypothetical protein
MVGEQADEVIREIASHGEREHHLLQELATLADTVDQVGIDHQRLYADLPLASGTRHGSCARHALPVQYFDVL